ncbi:MAG: hypothetical protein AAB390_03660 [Patescibacteria group bacterium]
MEARKENLLNLIIEDYIKTAEPVGSKFLVRNYRLEFSDATIRNEMRELEEEGFLTHPHPSAGRIPTEQGYKYYVEHLPKAANIGKKTRDEINDIIAAENDSVAARKNVAKFISDYLNTSVIVAYDDNNVYYTGIANLFSQPEFSETALTVNMSAMLDQCEEVIEKVFELVLGNESVALIGRDNPLGGFGSIIGVRVGDDGLFIILGPMRMDYAKSKNILEYLVKII